MRRVLGSWASMARWVKKNFDGPFGRRAPNFFSLMVMPLNLGKVEAELRWSKKYPLSNLEVDDPIFALGRLSIATGPRMSTIQIIRSARGPGRDGMRCVHLFGDPFVTPVKRLITAAGSRVLFCFGCGHSPPTPLAWAFKRNHANTNSQTSRQRQT